MSSRTLTIGLLLIPGFQWLDAAGPVDYLNSHSHTYLSVLPGAPKELVDKAYHIKWYYISTDLTPVHATSGPPQLPTCTYADCPTLDYLIAPGPYPNPYLPEGCAAFLQKVFVQPQFKAILMICTGSVAVAQSGILDGLKVCSNKEALKAYSRAGILNKNVKWVGDRRWIVDGKAWSSASVTSGIDLAAEFARVHFDPALVAMVKDAMEYEAKPDKPDPFARIMEGVDLT